jgi:hypothetical protein
MCGSMREGAVLYVSFLALPTRLAPLLRYIQLDISRLSPSLKETYPPTSLYSS